jgi:PhoH-like ATPase
VSLAEVSAAPSGLEGAATGPATTGIPTTTGTVVLDTSVLLADPESIFSFGPADVVLPLKVIEELDNHKGRMDEVGRAARTVARLLEELRGNSSGKDLKEPTPLVGGGTLRVVINGLKLDRVRELGLDTDKADNRILAAALGIPGPVTLVSADVNLRLKAAAVGLEAEEYRQVRANFHTEAHPGWKALDVSARLIDELFEAGTRGLGDDDLSEADRTAIQPLIANEFGVLNAGQQSALVRRQKGRLRVLPRTAEAWGLRPRSKEQRFALDLLMDPGVPIVGLSGRAGTGKTILAIAAGLEQTFEPGHYDRIMIIRPLVAVGRQDIGFLPGDKNEKLEPWFATVEDTMAALRDDLDHTKARAMLEGWVEQGTLSMEAVTFLRGRSLQRTFIIVDEAQNLEPLTLKTILTRLGTGSKVALVGDVSQIDSPFVSERTSAISILADRFAGQDLFGHLVLTQGERSPVADLAAELL